MLKKLKKSLGSVKKEEIVDIIAFGSAVKGKLMPNDVDICIVFRKKVVSELIKEIEDQIKKLNLNAHISALTIDNFFTKPHSLIKTMLNEGTSLLTGKAIAEQYGLSSYSMYSYSLKGLKPSDRVRFVYTLKGRNREQGLIKKLGGEWIADGCFIMPITKDAEIIDTLNIWKVQYKRRQALLMS